MIGSVHFDSLLVMLALGMAGLVIVIAVGARTQTLAPCITAFAAHVALSLALFYTVGMSALGPDAGTYHVLAGQVADSLAGTGQTINFAEGKEGWIYVLGLLYFVVGKIPEAGLLTIAILMGTLPAILAVSSRLMNWERSANTAAWIAVFLPSLLIWPSSFLREGPSIFILSLMVLAIGLHHASRTIPAGVLLLLATLCMMWVRPVIGIAALLAIAIGAVLAPVRGSGSFARSLLFLLPAAMMLPLGLIRGDQLDLTAAGVLRTNLSLGASTSTGATGEGFDSTIGGVLGSLRDMPSASFGPFPWEALHQPLSLAIDGLTFLVLVLLAIPALRSRSSRRGAIALLLPAIAILFVVAATFGNYGFAVRQRSQAAPFLVPVAAAGWILYRQRRQGIPLKLNEQSDAVTNA